MAGAVWVHVSGCVGGVAGEESIALLLSDVGGGLSSRVHAMPAK